MEDLLKPRFKVIADYPLSSYNVGRILTPISKGSSLYDCIEASSSEKIRNPNKYPHLFKKLEWWEDRSLYEMPDYVKFIQNPFTDLIPNKIYWVKEKLFMSVSSGRHYTVVNPPSYFCKIYGIDSKKKFNFCLFDPATEEDYLNLTK